jgi:hypothetical protein
LTVLASRTNEKALSVRPNSSARPGSIRPAGHGALLGALAHQPVDVPVEDVVQRARAAAGERETCHRRQEEPSEGSPRSPTTSRTRR